MWKSADRSKGFPVFLLYDELLDELLEENLYEGEADIEAYLHQREEEESEFLDADYIMGNPDDTAEGIYEFSSFEIQDDADIFLVNVTVENPWQIFEKLPFGAYNECPAPNILSAFSKMTYEKFGAVPAVISSDTLEFAVSRRPSKQEAFGLAQQMYLLCPDIVDQGYGSIYALADCLTKSDIWFFWWD